MSASLELGSIVPVETERPATGGAVGRLSSGEVAFVRLALPGERVQARITQVRGSFVRAEAVEVERPSPERVSPPCPYAVVGGCGGCDLQHASVTSQREWKSAVLAEHLRRITRIERTVDVVDPGVGAHGSRTRVRCAVDEQGRLGLRRAGTNEIVALESCWLADDQLADAFGRDWSGFDEVELRAIDESAPFAVARRDVGDETEFHVLALDGSSLPADTASMVRVGRSNFRVGPLSFWQSHRSAPEILLGEVMGALDLHGGEKVVDLYSGVGLFAVPIGEAVGADGRVDAVESSPDSAADLEFNARHLNHLKVRPWRVTPRSINDVVTTGAKVVLDPPRAGVGIKTMEALLARRPSQLVYVSCDAATFARDLKVALDARYELRSLKAFDLFPMTEHVELVAVLDSPL